jgi:HPt (histidine-containing phosphotransfer) domain-containing protein
MHNKKNQKKSYKRQEEPMKITGTVPIELNKALERTGGDEEFLFDLIEVYISDFKIRLEALNNAVMDRNFDQLYYQGHTLKGSSSNLNLTSLQEYAFRIETAGREKDLDLARIALKKLGNAFRDFQKYYTRMLKIKISGVA